MDKDPIRNRNLESCMLHLVYGFTLCVGTVVIKWVCWSVGFTVLIRQKLPNDNDIMNNNHLWVSKFKKCLMNPSLPGHI